MAYTAQDIPKLLLPPSGSFPGFEVSVTLEPTPNGSSGVYQEVSVESDKIPESFFQGLADIQHGRTVDMERALNEPPPED